MKKKITIHYNTSKGPREVTLPVKSHTVLTLDHAQHHRVVTEDDSVLVFAEPLNTCGCRSVLSFNGNRIGIAHDPGCPLIVDDQEENGQAYTYLRTVDRWKEGIEVKAPKPGYKPVSEVVRRPVADKMTGPGRLVIEILWRKEVS